MKARISEVKVMVDKEEYYLNRIMPIWFLMSREINKDEGFIIELLEGLELPLSSINLLIDTAATHGYHQVYLTLLKKKEQLNGFAPASNFEL